MAVRVTRQAVWELAAPSGTCPTPSDFTAAVRSCWFHRCALWDF